MIGVESEKIKIGLEIHFQVKGRKLFCSCQGEESENYTGRFLRTLRATSGEMASRDVAAVQESLKQRVFEYLITDNSCLVEMDEEPPHRPSSEAIEGSLIVSKLLHATPVDNLVFMRKIVIDGSNTSGFQRTGIVGLNGSFEFNGKRIGITSITLEEEACKKLDEKGNQVLYSLDRLGIPLIEIATDPDITSPREARLVAEAIGLTVKQSRMIRREVSSIRQDLNVSINGGKRVEIKGVQSLTQIEEILEMEIKRQEILNEIAVELRKKKNIGEKINPIDMTASMKEIESDMIRKAIASQKRVIVFKLRGLSGFLNKGNYRLGRELADRLRAIGIGGLIHSDELPNYGFTENDKKYLFQATSCEYGDAFAILLVRENEIENAISAIERRVLEALDGVPAETRAATPNGTRFLRPLPGGARMYPETDIPVTAISNELLSNIYDRMPPTLEERKNQLVALGIPEQEAYTSMYKEYDELLESLVKKYGNPKIAAKLLSSVFSREERNLPRAQKILELLSNGKVTKDVVVDLYFSHDSLDEIVSQNSVSNSNLDTIKELVKNNRKLVMERGESSFKLLMGEAMKSLRGKLDGKVVSETLMKEIKLILEEKEQRN